MIWLGANCVSVVRNTSPAAGLFSTRMSRPVGGDDLVAVHVVDGLHELAVGLAPSGNAPFWWKRWTAVKKWSSVRTTPWWLAIPPRRLFSQREWLRRSLT
jgi:hypothetical protein